MGIPEKDFWKLTLNQFNALAERYLSLREREDYRSAQICAVLATVFCRRQFKVSDFMPREKTEQTPEQMMQMIEMWNIALGGENE